MFNELRNSCQGQVKKGIFSNYFDFVLGVSSTSHLIFCRRAVLRIRDVYPASQIRIFSSRNPSETDSGSRIPHTRIKYFWTQKLLPLSKLFGNIIRDVHPGCSPWIRILIFTNPGSRGQKGTGSRIRNTVGPPFVCKLSRHEGKKITLLEKGRITPGSNLPIETAGTGSAARPLPLLAFRPLLLRNTAPAHLRS